MDYLILAIPAYSLSFIS